MKKKLVSVLLTVAMVAAMLSGCGGSSDSSDNSGSEVTSDSTETETETETETTEAVSDGSSTTTSIGTYTAENPYHLVFEYLQLYDQDEAATQAVEDELNEYMRETYHMEVEFLPASIADYQQTTQLMLSGGDELDVFPILFSNAASWINMGGIYDMSELMDTEDAAKIIDALGEENAYVGTMNGILFGFPANKESIELGGLCMRADICDELGLTEKYNLDRENSDIYDGETLTWDEAEEIFAAVKEAYPNMYPLYLSNSDQLARFTYYDPLVDSYGVLDMAADKESTTVVNLFETDQYKEAVTRLAKWYDAGYIYPDAATDTQGTAAMMKAGNTFSYASAIKPGFLAEAEAANGCECYVLYVNRPEGGYISTTNVSFYDTGIAAQSKDPEMAFKFIAALYSDATLYNYWQYGIEGVNYQVLDDGTAYFVDGEDGSNYKYHQNIGWELGNQFISYVWNDGTKTADYWDELMQHNEWAYYSPAFGFMWDSGNYSTEITALSNAYDTYRAALNTGSVGSANVDSTIDALNDALYAAGLQDVIDEKQAQLDAWLAENK